ncbi:MAG: phosphotransferase [Planctomycetota bacterium]|jgi:RIO-like serine/threonine protein kinase|nr:phosphotransferase [Planctomycetota bacterium]MDP6939828.1 phosphotransferase [Planctomycetota bacterium]
MGEAHIITELKSDLLGSVELLGRGEERVVRRLATGSRLPGSALLARHLMARERRSLGVLTGLAGVPRVVDPEPWASLAEGKRAASILLREHISGEPLHRARVLPRDFFDLLDGLVLALHEHGVCHNDLHKEQNILVQSDGRPALIDFQLASVHAGQGALFRSRVQDDLRHLQKHRRRYTRDGRGPVGEPEQLGPFHGLPRTGTSALWRRTGKPLYLLLTRGLLKTRDGEERRPSSGPWPEWTDALGPDRS